MAFVPVSQQEDSFTTKLDRPPVQDSPTTPATPESPQNITVSVAGCEGAAAKSPPDRSVPVLVSSVATVSTSLCGVVRVCRGKNNIPTTLFEPSSCEAAKVFLSAAAKRSSGITSAASHIPGSPAAASREAAEVFLAAAAKHSPRFPAAARHPPRFPYRKDHLETPKSSRQRSTNMIQ